MEALLVKYGYVVLFGGVIVEGEAFLLTAAFLAHRGILHRPAVVAVAIAATMFGDQVYYQAARARGRAWLERRKGVRARYTRIIDMTARRGPWLLLVSRYTFGFRIVIPAACGAAGMPVGLFTFVDFVAVGIWALLTGALGYYGGAAVARYLHDFKQIVVWLAVALVLCVAAVISFRRMTREARLKELGMADVHAVMPFVMSLLAVVNIASALWPHAPATQAMSRHLPLEVGHGSRTVMLFAGLALLQVSRNLARRKEAAWWVAVLALSLSFVSHLRPVVLRRRQEAPPEVVADLCRSHGHRSLSAFAARADKHHLLVAGDRGLVAFAVRHSAAVACGDPLAPPEALEESVRDFVQRCRRNGWTPAVYGVPEEHRSLYEKAGLKLLPIAQEAVISLREGVPAAWPEPLAARLREARAAGLSVRRYDRALGPEP